MSFVMIRLVHVLLGIFWGGTVLFSMLYLDPATKAAGPAGGEVMQQLQKRGYLGAMILVGTITVITGTYLLYALIGTMGSSFMGTTRGILLSTGALTGFLTLAVVGSFSRPTARKMKVVAERMAESDGAPNPDDVAEMARLRARVTLGLRMGGVLMAVTLGAMVFGAHGG